MDTICFEALLVANILILKFFICRIIEALDESFHEPPDSATRQSTKKYECTICGFATDRLFNFKRHIQVHSDADNSGSSMRNHLCNQCGKPFATLSDLTRHSQ